LEPVNNLEHRENAKKMTLCANCHHEEEAHALICRGDITCLCEKFVPPILFEFAQKIDRAKDELKTHYQRCKWLLEKLPATRNAGSKTFYKVYCEIWHGVKIRKELGITTKEWKAMPVSSTVNRSKRFVKQDHPELGTYSPQMLIEQSALWEAIVEMAIER
jgi:hypothetical protein